MKFKSEKGSITVLVLAMCLITTMGVVGLIAANKNKLRAQERQQKIIQEQYNEDARIDQIYEKAVQNQ